MIRLLLRCVHCYAWSLASASSVFPASFDDSGAIWHRLQNHKGELLRSSPSSDPFDLSSCLLIHEPLSHAYGGRSGFMAIAQWLSSLVLSFFGGNDALMDT